MSALFDLIRIPFGFLIRWIYSWSSNYVLAIVLFSILLKIILFPFGIKQQKNSQKQAALRPKENVIRKKYAGRNDRATQMKLNTELQELYQQERFSPMAGCLPLMLQMLVLLAVYAVIRAPMTYIASIPALETTNNAQYTVADTMKQTAAYMVYEEKVEGNLSDFVNARGLSSESTLEEFNAALASGSYNYYAELNASNLILKNRKAFEDYLIEHNKNLVGDTESARRENIRAAIDAIPDLELFSDFNLGNKPSLSSLTDSEAALGTKLLLLIPLLTVVTSYFGQALTRKFTYQPESTKEQKSQMRMMSIFMPLFSLYLSFTLPAAVAVYWIISNVLGPVQQIILAKMFPIKEITPEEMREAERLYGGKQKKAPKPTASGKKKRSLVYDDDDDIESDVPAGDKSTAVAEKADAGESIVPKAKLKDSDKE